MAFISQNIYITQMTQNLLYFSSIIIIGIQPSGWFGQRPELSQATGTLHPGQVRGCSLPLLSPAFRRSHFCH